MSELDNERLQLLVTDCLSLGWRPLPLGCWCLSSERFPSLPAKHLTSQNQLLLSLQDQLFGLAAVDCILESFDVFVLKLNISDY